MRAGASKPDAERQARLELGGLESLKEDLREARGQRLFDELRQDLRYAARRFRRSRGPAVAAVLALGIGVNLAVFSVIDAALLRPLPHPDPDRLVSITSRSLESGREHQTAPLDFFDFERRAASFASMAAYYPPGFTLTSNGPAERVSGARASSGIFDVFGVRPALGRGFLPAEDHSGTAAVAVISHSLWLRHYGGDPGAIGQRLVLSGRDYTLVGVLPDGFHSPAMWPRMPDVWVPLGLDPNVGRRDARMLRVLGRLKPGVTVAQASGELDAIAGALAAEFPAINSRTGAGARGLLDELTRDVRPSLYALAAAVVALLLVACGNAAGLLLGSALERRHEFATRLAIGASRGRIIRQIVAESLLVGLLAAGLGFVLALSAADFLVGAATAAGVPRAAGIRVAWPALLAGILLSVACTTACALVAALPSTRARDLRVTRGTAVTPRRQAARATLIGVQAALSLALLVGAALLARSFHELRTTEPGFDAANLFTARLSAPQARYPAGPVLAAFYDRALERVRAIDGVEHASVVDWLPVSGFGASAPYRLARNAADGQPVAMAELRVVGSDYFQTIDTPVLAGRTFDPRDTEGAPKTVVVNDAMARAHFAERGAVGERLVLDRNPPLEVEIVGVVGDIREMALRLPAGPTIYAPKSQAPWLRHETRDLIVRSRAGAEALIPAVQTVLRDLEPEMPRPAVQRVADVIDGALARPGFYAAALGIFALTAALLAGFGIFGTVTSAVAERRRELGVRLALGASRRSVLVNATRYGTVPTLVGLAAGLPLAIAAGRLLRHQLYGVGPSDWVSMLLAAALMASAAIGAALVPALRAARIDPAATLRHDEN